MSARTRLAVDCMGGDFGPAVTVPAAMSLATEADLMLCGDQAQIEAYLPERRPPELQLVHAPESVDMSHGLRSVLRDRRPTSLGAALQTLAGGEADAVVSGADTAALMALARHQIGMLPNVDRPAIAKEIIGKNGTFWMADLGANVRCSPEQLAQFARMGVVAARSLSGCAAPRVALLNIGTEQRKGPQSLRAACGMLESLEELNFVGYVEGSRLFENDADVIICDGYVGNITLKAVEGTAAMAGHLLGQKLKATQGLQRLLLSLLKPTIERVRGSLDTEKYNGAAFLGLQKVVVKSHGGASMKGVTHALRRAVDAARSNVPGVIAGGMTRLD